MKSNFAVLTVRVHPHVENGENPDLDWLMNKLTSVCGQVPIVTTSCRLFELQKPLTAEREVIEFMARFHRSEKDFAAKNAGEDLVEDDEFQGKVIKEYDLARILVDAIMFRSDRFMPDQNRQKAQLMHDLLGHGNPSALVDQTAWLLKTYDKVVKNDPSAKGKSTGEKA